MSQLKIESELSNPSSIIAPEQQKNQSLSPLAKHPSRPTLYYIIKFICQVLKLPLSIIPILIKFSYIHITSLPTKLVQSPLSKHLKKTSQTLGITHTWRYLKDQIMQWVDSMLVAMRHDDKRQLMRGYEFTQELVKSVVGDEKEDVGLECSSNQVLFNMVQSGEKRTITYYVPTYLRVLLKNFTAIDLEKLQAQVNLDIIVTFVYGNKGLLKLPKEVANRLNSQIVLNFQRDQPLRLTAVDCDHISVKEDEAKSYITFTIRKKFHMKIQSDVYYTPFERLDLLFPVTIQQITAATIDKNILGPEFESPRKNTKEYVYEAGIKFNYMDNLTPFVKIDFKQQTDFGNYSLIQSGMEARYSNKRIASPKEEEKKKEEMMKEEERWGRMVGKIQRKRKMLERGEITGEEREKLEEELKQLEVKKERKETLEEEKRKKSGEVKPLPDHFQYSLFKIPIYKHPIASLVMIFLPLWSLSIIKLGIFFQGQSLSQRISSIAGVMIAFIALIPLIRSQIPPNPKVLFIQCLVYAQIFASFLCLVDSLQVRVIQNYQMQWTSNIFYIVSLLILVIQVIVIIRMTIYHFVVSLYHYKLDQNGLEWQKDKSKSKFVHSRWGNVSCDRKFEHVISQTRREIKFKSSKQWEAKKLADVSSQLLARNSGVESQKRTFVRQLYSLQFENGEKVLGKSNSMEQQSV